MKVTSWPAMGTVLELKIVGAPHWDAEAECRPLVAEWESRLSRFLADSDVARLQEAGGDWVHVSPTTDEVLTLSLEAHDVTGGAFDVCANPADLYTLGRVPSEESVGRPQPESPYPLERRTARSWRLARGHTLDLGGIAKGIVAEKLCDLAQRRGASGALVNFGSSSLTCFGHSESGEWRVALRAPGRDRDAAIGYLPLSEGYSLSVSGHDERGSHIISPFTADRKASNISCAAVSAPHGGVAEYWSTALIVLGSAGLPRLTEHCPESKAAVITSDQVISSPHWFRPL
ncbi:MAG: FAD:protein FMN transferase [Propionibacteriaceae bacterium]|jgi:thiamine biosynthesis lipoprotein|nr:FAD:protein FMN transferase [Propionibacteriaceae bacterium]